MAKEPELPTWIAEHMKKYIATNGADGHIWNGVPTLLLTTIGAKSLKERTLPLIYGRDGDRYVIVASRGGAPDHPAWYKNLVAHSDVGLQVAADKFKARASTAQGADRKRLWQTMTKIWPAYDEYQTKTKREIPVVVLEKVARP
jgi:deazaflavin-dependent oxidoreductase (nitroreductase family)